MNKPLSRRHVFPYLCVAITAPAVSVVAPPVATARTADDASIPHGYGRCSACACPAYSGNQWVCDNCGHAYQTHW